MPNFPMTPEGSSGGSEGSSPSSVSSRYDLHQGTPTTAVSAIRTAPGETTHLLSPTPKSQPNYWTDDDHADAAPGPSSLGRARGRHLQIDYPRTDHSREDSTASQSRLRKTYGVAKTIRQRSTYYVPVTGWLPQYSWQLFSGDLVAGVSVACLLVPQAMSYANGLAKITPVAGLWASAVGAAVYGVMGTCRQMSMGPEASLSLMLGHVIEQIVYGDPHTLPENPEREAMAVTVMITFQAGLITTILGLLRLGFLDVVLSRALLRGFITGIGVIILIEQLAPLLGLVHFISGHVNPPTYPIMKLIFTLKHIRHANIPTTILSACSIAFLLAFKLTKQAAVKRPGGTWLRYVPEILILVVTTTVLCAYLRWDELGVYVVGKIPGGKELPFGMPLTPRTLKYFGKTFPTAFVMAVVGVVDSMVAARENATKYGYPVSPNRELVALGSANLATSLVTGTGTLPIFGSLTRSRLNGQTGCRTQMSGFITAALMILSVFFLLPSLYFLPKAVLSSIIIMVVYVLLAEAPHDVIYFWKMRAWTDFLQMTGTFLLTTLFSIETGLLASVGFSLILVIQRSTQPRIKIIGRRPDTDEWVPIDDDEDEDAIKEEIPGVLVVRIRESLSFANTGQLKERLRRLELYGPKKSHPSDVPRRREAKAVILHMGDVDDIDASALQILGELVQSYHERGVGIYFAHLRASQLAMLRLVNVPQLLGPHRFHPDLRSAMREVESLGFGTRVASSRFA